VQTQTYQHITVKLSTQNILAKVFQLTYLWKLSLYKLLKTSLKKKSPHPEISHNAEQYISPKFLYPVSYTTIYQYISPKFLYPVYLIQLYIPIYIPKVSLSCISYIRRYFNKLESP